MFNIRDPQQLCDVRVAERDVLEAGEFEWVIVERENISDLSLIGADCGSLSMVL